MLLKSMRLFLAMSAVGGLLAGLSAAPAGVRAEPVTVRAQDIRDRKAVFATVEAADLLRARARIGGTVVDLTVDEGSQVEAGARIAAVVDEKLALEIRSADARIQSVAAERGNAATDLKRARELRASGTVPQARLDAAETALRVLDRNLASARAEREVIVQRAREGAVLAPGAGRVLDVKVTEGAVVLPGEAIATLAADKYYLRLTLPERHARFLSEGDGVLVGPRGVQVTSNHHLRGGRVVKVYPRMRQGRVVADVETGGLDDYLVGERTLVYVDTGLRRAFVVPEAALYRRFGLSYVRLEDGTEVVVQAGRPVEGGIEVLSGLRDGDRVMVP